MPTPPVIVLSLDASSRVRRYFPNAPEVPNDGCVLIVPEEFDTEPLWPVRRELLRDNLPQTIEDALVDGGDRFMQEHRALTGRYFPPDEFGNMRYAIVFTNAPRQALWDRLVELGASCFDGDTVLAESTDPVAKSTDAFDVD